MCLCFPACLVTQTMRHRWTEAQTAPAATCYLCHLPAQVLLWRVGVALEEYSEWESKAEV